MKLQTFRPLRARGLRFGALLSTGRVYNLNVNPEGARHHPRRDLLDRLAPQRG